MWVWDCVVGDGGALPFGDGRTRCLLTPRGRAPVASRPPSALRAPSPASGGRKQHGRRALGAALEPLSRPARLSPSPAGGRGVGVRGRLRRCLAD
ncbi:hypothetical protein F7R02_12295 [Xanthomonas cissicola]|nr:hypothetical protein F7R02_12295 [Xanthomonas cissicola]